MQDVSFYQSHLDRVSRSFAICIPKLGMPFRQWISLSYLLCRILDTVEDAPWTESRLQDGHYGKFARFAERLPCPAEVRAWAEGFPRGLPDGEARLLRDAYALFEDLHALPEAPRRAIQGGVTVMREGMQHYSAASRGGILRLTDLGDVNRYCFFVAGVVGQLATELYLLYRPDFRPSPALRRDALHFGLFLQKVNILKDQGDDQRAGRHFVPDRAALLSSLRPNAEGALRYLTSLPADERGYRTFCGWSLFLGAASLPWLEQSHQQADASKIPRAVTLELLDSVEEMIQDDGALRRSFAEYAVAIPRSRATEVMPGGGEDLSWFHALARSRMDGSAMSELGMI